MNSNNLSAVMMLMEKNIALLISFTYRHALLSFSEQKKIICHNEDSMCMKKCVTNATISS